MCVRCIRVNIQHVSTRLDLAVEDVSQTQPPWFQTRFNSVAPSAVTTEPRKCSQRRIGQPTAAGVCPRRGRVPAHLSANFSRTAGREVSESNITMALKAEYLGDYRTFSYHATATKTPRGDRAPAVTAVTQRPRRQFARRGRWAFAVSPMLRYRRLPIRKQIRNPGWAAERNDRQLLLRVFPRM